ncbi:sulfatase [Echinicola sediminis]
MKVNHYTKADALKALLVLCFLFFNCIPAFSQDKDRPNVLFILVDDLGYHDLSVTGSDFYETPHIDGLAKSSFQFVQGYTAARVCSPARASIMTGVSPAVHGITDWIGAPEGEDWRKYGRHTKLLPPSYRHDLDPRLLTLPQALKENGYETFFAGKWHLGGEGSLPEDRGFDINVGGWDKGSPMGGYFAPYVNPKMEQGPDGENLSLRLANETADFIGRAHEKPFFAMLSFYAVHGPIQTTEEKWNRYRQKAVTEGIQEHGYEMERRLPIRKVQDNPVYAGLVETMDEAVGKVLSALEQAGLEDNTIVIFTSDHGGVASGDNFSTSNLPLRGGKGYQWEGGLRVPYFIKVPGMAANKEIDYPASGIDFMPTVLDLVGTKPKMSSEIEGISLVPAMKGKRLKGRQLYWHYPHYGNQGGDPSSVVRDGKWKLIYYWEDQAVELYDLEKDPSEENDLGNQEVKIRSRLEKDLMKWLMATSASKPRPDPAYNASEEKKVLDGARDKRMPQLEKERMQMFAPEWKPNADWWGSKVTKD